ncbi:hypothetical protein, conserved [Angomonas deanei]|uniref:Uncharacterized protein n=1 Tax=Angomonas deanei TaxID=59799 RepID=A0A7G2CC41_9TRYP|nr:hypothetical protein, conserved [Angomonas deanei]
MPKKNNQEVEKAVKKGNEMLGEYAELDRRIKAASETAAIDAITESEKKLRAKLLQVKQTLDGVKGDSASDVRTRIVEAIQAWDLENAEDLVGDMDEGIDGANDDTFGDDTVGVGSLNDLASMTSKKTGEWGNAKPAPASKPVNEWEQRKQKQQQQQQLEQQKRSRRSRRPPHHHRSRSSLLPKLLRPSSSNRQPRPRTPPPPLTVLPPPRPAPRVISVPSSSSSICQSPTCPIPSTWSCRRRTSRRMRLTLSPTSPRRCTPSWPPRRFTTSSTWRRCASSSTTTKSRTSSTLPLRRSVRTPTATTPRSSAG